MVLGYFCNTLGDHLNRFMNSFKVGCMIRADETHICLHASRTLRVSAGSSLPAQVSFTAQSTTEERRRRISSNIRAQDEMRNSDA